MSAAKTTNHFSHTADVSLALIRFTLPKSANWLRTNQSNSRFQSSVNLSIIFQKGRQVSSRLIMSFMRWCGRLRFTTVRSVENIWVIKSIRFISVIYFPKAVFRTFAMTLKTAAFYVLITTSNGSLETGQP